MNSEKIVDILRKKRYELVDGLLAPLENWPDTLYHYTNVKGCRGIFRSSSVFLSNLRYLNDPNELTYVFDIALECLDENRTDWHKSYTGKTLQESVRYFISTLISDSQEADLIWFNEHEDHYVCSLSESPDSLDQWRAYGDNGLGYCLGIQPRLIRNLEVGVPHRGITTPAHAYLVKVLYNRVKQKEIIKAYFDSIIENLPSDEPDADDYGQIEHHIKEQIIHFLQDLRYVIKHDAYTQEREWRIVKIDSQNYLTPEFFEWLSNPDGADKPKEAVATAVSAVKTRVRGHEILPYLEFSLEEVEENKGKPPIGRIIVGPRTELTTYSLGIIHFLKELGYNEFPNVIKSAAPYRA